MFENSSSPYFYFQKMSCLVLSLFGFYKDLSLKYVFAVEWMDRDYPSLVKWR